MSASTRDRALQYITCPVFCWVRDTYGVIDTTGKVGREIISAPVLPVLVYMSVLRWGSPLTLVESVVLIRLETMSEFSSGLE
jgi:hypothetical protein